jgi:predicted nucleotidyltransferase
MGRSKKSLSREEVLSAVEARKDEIRAFGVRRLGLFGSFARGEANASSDLDFVVDFERKSFDAYMDLKFFLEDLFGRRVDLVITDSVKPRLRPYIQADTVYAQGL